MWGLQEVARPCELCPPTWVNGLTVEVGFWGKGGLDPSPPFLTSWTPASSIVK